MNRIFSLTALLLTALMFFSCASPEQTMEQGAAIPVEDCFAFAGEQLADTALETGDAGRFPFYVKPDGTWETSDSAMWSSGFFAGCLWLMYEHSGDDIFKQHAVKWTESLEQELSNNSDADIGYRILNSYGNAYRLTGEEKYKAGIIEAAGSLASRYSDTVQCVEGYDMEEWKFPVLIDHMMNIELLFLGARLGGDPEWKTMAEKHALRTIDICIRDDNSTIQVVDCDPETGEVTGHYTICGLSGDSSWSRGHGEGLYGFAIAYRETQNPRFLETAQTLADYFIAHLPEDNVPFWDFSDPAIPNTIRDASAASMAADGLFELCSVMDESPAREKYYAAAVAMLESLCSAPYFARGTESPGILNHATWKTPNDPGADTSLIWGDCNFLSALTKYQKGM